MARWTLDDEAVRGPLPAVLADVGKPRSWQVLEGGTYKTVLAVQLDDGREVIVKISPPHDVPGLSFDPGRLLREADYFRRTRPYGVPVPEVLAEGCDVFAQRRRHVVETKLHMRCVAHTICQVMAVLE